MKLKFNVAKLSVTLALIAASTFAGSIQAKDILTSTPVTYMLASELMKGTEVTTEYLPPKRYGVERLPNWYASKGNEKAQQLGKDASVALTLASIWQQDPTYVYSRQGNIRLIEVDAAQAITPRAQGVASLTLDNGSTSKYAWLNPTNLIRMAAIVADDFKKVWPSHAVEIDRNLQALMLDVRSLINQQQSTIFENEIDSVVLLSESLEDFASGNQLFVVERVFQAELEWTDVFKQELKTQFEDDDSLWLVTSRKPSKTLLALVPEARILVVDSVDRWGSKGITRNNPLARWMVEVN
ncbi:ABC transporter substrate-binding protein [Vibrio sp. T187]|uniref:ABC transporter substrate-binding protein n=1 Tax=Vibrio TaxID=662 RepID=UPI0010C9A380|nr:MULTISPECIES: ABC transporter substrate-binding protein [Vibrio]MBW3698104.1 ABC transporter substrate-binding protein [Vibrio sp. T187]